MISDMGGMWNRLNLSSNPQEKVKQLIQEAKKLFLTEQYKDASQLLLKAVNDDPDNLEAHYFLGLIFTKTLDFDKALIHFNEIIMSKFQYLHKDQVRQVLAYIYSLQGDYASSREYIDEILAETPNDINALSILGFVLTKEKNYPKAIENYSKILGIDAKNANAYNSLGFIFIESGENIDKGIETCKKALDLKPDTPAYLDSVGWGYYKKGDEVEAMKYLKKAFEKAPDNLEIKEHLKIMLNI